MGLEDKVTQKELQKAEKMDARIERETKKNLGDLYKDTVSLLGSFDKKKGLATAALGVLMYVGPVAGPGKMAGEYLTGGEVGTVASAEYNAKGYAVPDLSGAKYLGKKIVDKINEITGKETIIKGYKKNGKQFLIYSLRNGTIYAYGINVKNKVKRYVIYDNDNDGIFESKGKSFLISKSKYGLN